MEAILRRSVYGRIGNINFAKGAIVDAEQCASDPEMVSIKKLNYDGPIRMRIKSKDVIVIIRWTQPS